MAESTQGNEVYLDKDGKVVGKGDRRALTVISRREAEERGLMAKTDASAPQPSDRIFFEDGSSVQHLSGTNLTTPNPVPAVSGATEGEEDAIDAKAESRRIQGKEDAPESKTEPVATAAESRAQMAEAQTEEEDEEADTHEKAIKSAPEDKSVHKTAKK